jgi:hypothetical protein
MRRIISDHNMMPLPLGYAVTEQTCVHAFGERSLYAGVKSVAYREVLTIS